MRILFVATLHHPTQLIDAIQVTPPGEPRPLFPSSMGQHHLELALRAAGHEMDVFYRNLPGATDADLSRLREQRYTTRLTPGKVLRAVANRLPPRFSPGKRRRNQHLLEKARAFRPDVLYMVGDNTVIYPETLAAIREQLGCCVVYASGTSPIVFSHAIERQAARYYDLVLVNDFYHGMQWRELGARRMANLPISAINPDFHKPYDLSEAEANRYACDVAFVGTLLPDNLYSERVAALEALRDFDLGIWSVHDVPVSLRPHLRGPALGEEMMRIMSAAKLTVNVHGDFMRYGGNMRLFETAGVGVCQVADDLPGVREWFTPGEHLHTFDSIQTLQETVQRLLAAPQERAQLAAASRRHVLAHHTYAHRVQQFETLIEEIAADDG